MWKSFTIELKQAHISAKEKGVGSHVLICIHGYLQDKHLFDQVWQTVPEDWKIVSIDMPLFGRSTWINRNKPMHKKFLRKLWKAFQQRYPDSELNLLGFSMGGKLSLNLVSTVKNPPKRVILIAPDGISSNPMQNFAMFNPLGKTLLRGLLFFPAPLIFVSKMAFRLKAIDRFTYNFMYGNFGSEKLREALRIYMYVYAGLKVSFKKIKKKTYEHEMQWQLIWGSQDGVISPKGISQFQQLIPEAKGEFIDTGHLVVDLKPKAVRGILDKFLLD